MASKMNKKELYEAYKKQQKEIGLLSLEVSNLENIREENCKRCSRYEDKISSLKDELELLTVDYDDAIADLGNEKRNYKELTYGLNKIIAENGKLLTVARNKIKN